jgi:hypothetical protein
MNDILLKQQGGNNTYIKLVGNGSFGCLLCPPIKLTDKTNKEIDYEIPGFTFDKITNCNYVAKILAIGSPNKKKDTYEDELKTLIKIKVLDPKGDYTPKLIYANIHKGECLLNSIQLLETLGIMHPKVLKCVKDKIDPNFDYGYIILENVGITIEKKYIISNNSFNNKELILFLIKFKKLLEFIRILYNKYYLHYDIKIDNMTVKKNGDLCLIDFGRTVQLNTIEDYNLIVRTNLKHNFFMYSFEPKIYNKLLNLFKEKNIKEYSFKKIKEYIKKNFKKLVEPYDIKKYNMIYLYNILVKIFKRDFENQSQFDNIVDYIYDCQEKYFSDYLDNCEINYLKYLNTKDIDDIDINIDINYLLYYIFSPIIEKIDIYCMGYVLAEVAIIFNKNYDNYDDKLKNRFENFIKLLLFNDFDNVDQFIDEIDELIKLI